jgi:membrane protease subunit HflK
VTDQGPQQELSEQELSPTDAPPGFADLAREKLGEFLKIPSFGWRSAVLAATLALLSWASTGVYKVQTNEQGVIQRFGKWVDTTQPGLHFHLPWPIETALLPRVTQVNQLRLGDPSATNLSREKQMLTGDENIVEADCTIVWQIKDAGQFLFKVAEPETALRIEAESALREVIARTPIQAALSDRRQQIADETRELLQTLLDSEQAGISVMQVQLQRVDPPVTVIDAFNDVQRARADQERARNEAEAYANDILPRARGDAGRIGQDAEAYRAQAVNLAEGDAKNFLAVYQSYAQAKGTTAWRLYLESVDEVLRKSSKVIVDSSGKGASSVLPYMPLGEPTPRAVANGARK